jgi:hypothetical protein
MRTLGDLKFPDRAVVQASIRAGYQVIATEDVAKEVEYRRPSGDGRAAGDTI